VGPKRELADLLSDVTLFSRCTSGQRRTVARHAQIADLPAGVELVREGEPGDALFVILEGEAVVQRDGVELNRVGPGAYFGELAILDGEPRSATVVAVTDVKVAVIGIRMFRTMLREFPDLAEQLLIGLAGELRAARAVQSQT
jgi:CRP-like cAMP-binding protein